MKITRPRLCSRLFLDMDVVAESFEALDQRSFDSLAVPVVEVIGAEVLVVHSVSEHMVGADCQRVGDSDDGSLLASASGESMVLGRRVAVPFVDCSVGCLR